MPGEETIFSCEQGVPFKWPKDVRLAATSTITLILPGAIVREGEEIASVIDAPDDAPISLDRSPEGNAVESFRLILSQNQSVAIRRSSMAMAISAIPGPIKLRMVK